MYAPFRESLREPRHLRYAETLDLLDPQALRHDQGPDEAGQTGSSGAADAAVLGKHEHRCSTRAPFGTSARLGSRPEQAVPCGEVRGAGSLYDVGELHGKRQGLLHYPVRASFPEDAGFRLHGRPKKVEKSRVGKGRIKVKVKESG